VKRIAAVAGLAVLTTPTAQAFPIVGGQGLVPNARAIVDYVQSTYPAVESIGGVRSDTLPDHPSGRAVDIMVGNLGLGDAIYADICSQKARFNIAYCMWRVADHFSHVHISVVS
jgi:hypothetical protein